MAWASTVAYLAALEVLLRAWPRQQMRHFSKWQVEDRMKRLLDAAPR